MQQYTIKIWVKIIAWTSALIIVGLNVKLVFEEVSGWMNKSHGNTWWIYALIFPVLFAVGFLLVYVLLRPIINKKVGRTRSNVPHGTALEIGKIDEVKYHVVGIAVDFSQKDRETIQHALQQGGKSAHYYLIHVVETAGAKFHGDRVLDHETLSDTHNMEKYQQHLQQMGFKSELAIGYGTAALEITKIVKKKHIELLVMGAHGHKGLSDLVFGTTVGKVRHNVDVPVLIVK
jgi:manganese transport protein